MLKLIGATLVALLTFGQMADAAGMFPLSRQQVFKNGKPAGGARLFLFNGGTSTPRVGYKDLGLTSKHPNPIEADADGRFPMVFLADGYYRQRLTTATGTLIFDDDGIPVLSTSAGGAGTTVDPNSVLKTGAYLLRMDDQPVDGYVRANGRTIGSALSGATERANADTQALYEHLWQFSNVTVAGGKGASAAADYAANKPMVLPNAAGRGLVGMDDMGAGAQGVITSSTCTSPTLPGSACGAQMITIAAANLPVSAPWLASAVSTGSALAAGDHSHAYSGTTGGISALHIHGFNYLTAANKNKSFLSGGGNAVNNVWGDGDSTISGSTATESVDHSHSYSGNTVNAGTHTHTLSIGTTVTMLSNAGGGQQITNLPPMLTTMVYLRL